MNLIQISFFDNTIRQQYRFTLPEYKIYMLSYVWFLCNVIRGLPEFNGHPLLLTWDLTICTHLLSDNKNVKLLKLEAEGAEPEGLDGASKIVLPGVGHFDEGIKLLNDSGFSDSIKNCVLRLKMPILGICLGMQLFCESSEEGTRKGLGLIPGKVLHLVHSYYVQLSSPELSIASTTYGSKFCSAFEVDNIFGVQFHPEKSHRFGINLMSNFVDL